MRTTLAVALALGLATPTGADVLQVRNPHARVRPMQKAVERLIADGMAGSETFRHLIRRIEASDVIVYVEARHDLGDHVGASTKYVSTSATDRFLRIQLHARHSPRTLVALLGHELQHVVEVAGQPEVRSPERLRDFYRRSGLRTGPDSFDSVAAREAGYRVREEMLRPAAGDIRLARRDATEDEKRALDGSSIGAAGAPLR